VPGGAPVPGGGGVIDSAGKHLAAVDARVNVEGVVDSQAQTSIAVINVTAISINTSAINSCRCVWRTQREKSYVVIQSRLIVRKWVLIKHSVAVSTITLFSQIN